MKRYGLIFGASVLLAWHSMAETPAEYQARMEWWRAARFGMFIHWDMSSVAGTEISWSRGATKPRDIFGHPAGYVEDPVYDNLYKRFDPVKFNADEWVRLAKEAGMKYFVFTAKHHGGFCMWDTKYTDYSIMHTPFKRDIVKELAEACHKQGMRFGLYYSQRDWHHPDYGVGDNAKYHAYIKGQLTELLTKYGKVDVMWFDSYGQGESIAYWKADEILALVKRLQPEIVVNNRVGVYFQRIPSLQGDFDTPEQEVGHFNNTRLWESCMCMSSGWSYRKDDHAKPFSECLKMLVSCATGDGNLLLNVGPNAEGEIPADQAAVLKEFGAWMKTHGESIYDTRGGPYRNGPWGGATYRGKTVYVHVFQWNGDGLVLQPLPEKILKAETLDGKPVRFEQTDAEVSFTMPAEQRDPADTVIKLTLDKPVSEILDGHAVIVRPVIRPDGTVLLPPDAAKLEGGVRVESRQNQMNLGYWTNPAGAATWSFDLPRAGRYAVTVDTASPEGGVKVQAAAGGQTHTGVASPTGSYGVYAPMALGTFDFPKAEKVTLRLSPADPAQWKAINVRAIVLVPAAPGN